MLRLALIAALALPAPASAAGCAVMVSRAQAYLAAHPDKAGTRPQTIDAQLQHQPTPASIAKAKTDSRAHLVELLANARAMQAAGDEAGCVKSFAAVEWMLRP